MGLEHQNQTLHFGPFRLLPAVRVRDRASLDELLVLLAACRAKGWQPAGVVLDSFVAGQAGGTGHIAPWELLAGFAPGVPIILAGGLTPDNVAAAIRQVRPYGVDVASGVESAPRKKDPAKVRDFVAAVRSA